MLLQAMVAYKTHFDKHMKVPTGIFEDAIDWVLDADAEWTDSERHDIDNFLMRGYNVFKKVLS